MSDEKRWVIIIRDAAEHMGLCSRRVVCDSRPEARGHGRIVGGKPEHSDETYRDIAGLAASH